MISQFRHLKNLLMALLLISGPTQAKPDVEVFALFYGKAILLIDGQRVILKDGQTGPSKVKLVKSDSRRAIVDVDGVASLKTPSLITEPITDPVTEEQQNSQTVILWSDQRGFFFTDATVNGEPVRFLVDTGANTIAMNEQTASRLNVRLDEAVRGIARTASGDTPIYGVTLDTVSVGGITLYDVQAGVLRGANPETPLLGDSFLSHVEMLRQGNRMELIKKY
ncbi:MAG: TIGR02281 family clan AA aspartic protease [Nitrospinae bacterium]|nr:TIGR02281 family clan AA aspartic protease [Nitrospinota bacterium]